jgi:cell division protein FtsZ
MFFTTLARYGRKNSHPIRKIFNTSNLQQRVAFGSAAASTVEAADVAAAALRMGMKKSKAEEMLMEEEQSTINATSFSAEVLESEMERQKEPSKVTQPLWLPQQELNPNDLASFAPKIVVVGVGGAGGNAVNNMIARGLQGVEFLVCNTDAQHLRTTLTDNRVQMGPELTGGLGCGANPEVGREAAEAAIDEILEKVQGANMVKNICI